MPRVIKWTDSLNWIRNDEEGDEEELVITLRATLEQCIIYTQCAAEGKEAPATTTEAFLVGLGALVADAQNFSIHLDDGDETDKEGEDADEVHFATTSLGQNLA